MWLSAIKLAVSAGSNIYAKKQKTKMADVRCTGLMHASRMAKGELEAYQGKLVRSPSIRLEGRGSFDNFKLADFSSCIWAVDIVMIRELHGQGKIVLRPCSQQLPSWFTNLWILVVASIYGIKGTQIFKKE